MTMMTTNNSESNLMKGFELVKSMIGMLHGDDKLPLEKQTALDTIALIPTLRKYLPQEQSITFFVDRIVPACNSIQDIPDKYLDSQSKFVLVEAFRQLAMSIANYLYGVFAANGVEVTANNVSILRSIVALNELGEEID